MGSPNFYTADDLLNPRFAYDDSAAASDNGYSDDPDNDLHYLVEEILNDLRTEVEAEVSDMVGKGGYNLLFHEVKVESGYHSGFQISIKSHHTSDDVEASLELASHDTPHFPPQSADKAIVTFYAEGFGNVSQYECPEMESWATFSMDEEGYVEFKPNGRAIEETIENELKWVQHSVALIAQKYGLRELVGSTWTSGLASVEDSQKEMDLHINPSWLESDAPERPKMKG